MYHNFTMNNLNTHFTLTLKSPATIWSREACMLKRAATFIRPAHRRTFIELSSHRAAIRNEWVQLHLTYLENNKMRETGKKWKKK